MKIEKLPGTSDDYADFEFTFSPADLGGTAYIKATKNGKEDFILEIPQVGPVLQELAAALTAALQAVEKGDLALGG